MVLGHLVLCSNLLAVSDWVTEFAKVFLLHGCWQDVPLEVPLLLEVAQSCSLEIQEPS